jgi:hypothetical protein
MPSKRSYEANPDKYRGEAIAWYRKNKERAAARNATWVKENKAKVVAYSRKWREANRSKRTEYAVACRRKKFGFTREIFQERLESQAGLCPICGVVLTKGLVATSASADHCHKTNRPRGVICKKCNTLLGLAGDDEAVLLAAVAYLRKWTVTPLL